MSTHPDTPALSVVVPVKNGAATIETQLLALTRQGVPLEVVVADNGSTDGTPVLVRAFSQRHPGIPIRVVDASGRPGVCHARNTGVAAARSGAIAICDADDEVAEGWAAAMVDALEQHAFVGGPLEYDRFNPSWAAEVRGRPMATALPTLEREGGPPWPFVIGANTGVRRDVHDAVGGFDETLRTGDDNDYAFRIRLKTGTTPHWAPGAVVHYRLRHGHREMYRQARHYGSGLVELSHRYADVWEKPVRPRRLPERVARAAARAVLVRNRADVGAWVWHLGWDAGCARAAPASVSSA